MFFKQDKKPHGRIDTLIGVDTVIDGDVQFSGGLRVDGTINGNVTASNAKPGTLVLSERGRISGAISVSHAVINGSVVGPVRAAEFIELQAKSHVAGDLSYKTLEMHIGARVEGKLIYLSDSSPLPTSED